MIAQAKSFIGNSIKHGFYRRKNTFYVINYENGETRYGDFNSYKDCLNYAESRNGGYHYTIEEYASQEEYESNL